MNACWKGTGLLRNRAWLLIARGSFKTELCMDAREPPTEALLTRPWFAKRFHNLALLAGNEGMEKTMETIIMGYTGTTIRIHSFNPS